MFKLKEKVIFIADSHYNGTRDILLKLLYELDDNKIIVDQLFLMGDIFDFLSYEISYFKIKNKLVIDLINKISKKIEIIYFEGNHDFNLKKLFPYCLVIPRSKQPILIIYKNKHIKLSHGDIYTPFLYDIYTFIIRNTMVLKLLNSIDIKFWLTKMIEIKLSKKQICKKNQIFKAVIEQRIKQYNCDLIIEGHFHQNILNDNYINIPSLFCDKEYLYLYNGKFSTKLI